MHTARLVAQLCMDSGQEYVGGSRFPGEHRAGHTVLTSFIQAGKDLKWGLVGGAMTTGNTGMMHGVSKLGGEHCCSTGLGTCPCL